MANIGKFLEKMANTTYMNRWAVLIFDALVSAFISLVVYLALGTFTSATIPFLSLIAIFVTSILVSGVVFWSMGIHRGIIRHASIADIFHIFLAVLIKGAILFVLFSLLDITNFVFIGVGKVALAEAADIAVTLCAFVLVRVSVVYIYDAVSYHAVKSSKNILIYGDDDKSLVTAAFFSGKSLNAGYNVSGFIVMGGDIKKLKLASVPVYNIASFDYLSSVIRRKNIRAIVFPDQKDLLKERDALVKFCLKEHIEVMLKPNMEEEVVSKDGLKIPVRNVNIEDLLYRDEIKIKMDEVSAMLSGKVVMVTGAAGSIGSELCRIISKFNVKQLIFLDNAETPMHSLQLEFLNSDSCTASDIGQKYCFLLADVRNRIRINTIFDMYRPQIVFHAAAYKHVPVIEDNPTEGAYVNIVGTKVVADAALRTGVEKMVMISTDKAVNPTNIMGATKRIAEIYTQSLSKAVLNGEVEGKTRFITTRFGKVLGSNGSVIPRFREQIKSGGPVTVTHPDIIRYFMTIPEACRLVMEAATIGKGYEIFVFDMGTPVKIADLAKSMIKLAGFEPDIDIKIVYTGLRQGEKLYEELLNTKENVIPTDYSKIFVAKTREYDYARVNEMVLALKERARLSDADGCVKIMKDIVPEFVSQNSRYAEFNK